MSQHWDEFSKCLAEESVPRRESLRRLGVVLAGAVLSPLGLETAWAGLRDPCRDFCRCRNKQQKNDCIAVCRACNNDPSRMCGSCGTYTCPDFESDVYNCGGCGRVCDPPGPWEYGACMFGECWYVCEEGAVYCDGECTFLDWDRDNCGACGNVCAEATPFCNWGTCNACPPDLWLCGNSCVDQRSDNNNCGGCGNMCDATQECVAGQCRTPGECLDYETLCNGRCVDLWFDNANCGACGHECPSQTACQFGVCQGSGDYYW